MLTLFIFKLNVALQLEMWSGGLLPPCWHRVVVPEGEKDVSKETNIFQLLKKKKNRFSQARQSLVYFIVADSDSAVEPVATAEGEEHLKRAREKYPKVNSGEHLFKLMNASNYYD